MKLARHLTGKNLLAPAQPRKNRLPSRFDRIRLSNGKAISVQRRISMNCIDFLMTKAGRSGLLKFCDFGEVEIANLHGGHNHFE